MDLRPFVPLQSARVVGRFDLPEDLAQFYAHNEGVGLESSPHRIARICLLSEVTRIGWRDLHVLGAESCPGWEGFDAFRIGVSSSFDEVVYVWSAPCCEQGAVLTLGVEIAGPGGHGPTAIEPSLVLAAGFREWLDRLERMAWVEYGLTPGAIAGFPLKEQDELRRYYKALNPQISWGTP